ARQRWIFLAIISAALFLVGADNSILYTALPELRDQLHTTPLQGLWIINAYPLVLSGLLLGTGTLGDKIGHRLMFMIGVMIRSEEHTSELQSRFDLVCRLLLEKKKKSSI